MSLGASTCSFPVKVNAAEQPLHWSSLSAGYAHSPSSPHRPSSWHGAAGALNAFGAFGVGHGVCCAVTALGRAAVAGVDSALDAVVGTCCVAAAAAHCLHLLRFRPWSHSPPPPHWPHSLRTRPCSQCCCQKPAASFAGDGGTATVGGSFGNELGIEAAAAGASSSRGRFKLVAGASLLASFSRSFVCFALSADVGSARKRARAVSWCSVRGASDIGLVAASWHVGLWARGHT